jgi:hypothetical protein
MRSGWLGGIAAVLVAVAVACSAEGSLTVNGRSVSLRPAAQLEGSSILVPVLAFAPLLGIEASERDGCWSLRWSDGYDMLAAWDLRNIAGVAYTSLEGLVARVGGSLWRVGGSADVEVPSARVVGFGVRDGELMVQLDRFSPILVTEEGGFHVVRFPNCLLGVAETAAVFGPGDVGSAALAKADESSCEVRISFLEEAVLAVRRLESDSAYSVFFAPAETPSATLTTALESGISFFEGEISVDGRAARVACVVIDAWRGRLDVRPLLPPAGVGTQASLDEVMIAAGAVAALSSCSDSDLGLVVAEGVPFSLGEGGAEVLGFDIFGSPVALVSEPVAFADLGASRLPLDGINRPIGYDELIGYPAGYTGYIARGFPDRFLVARLRDGAVVSILDATFVVADPSATLLVASGAARGRLVGLSIGDRVSLLCDVDPGQRFISDALSVDGMLLWDGGILQTPWVPARTWSVVGTDWLGGFFFLRASGDSDLSDADLLALLAWLPARARDAVVLECGGVSALALDVAGYHPRWGGILPISLALGAFLK